MENTQESKIYLLKKLVIDYVSFIAKRYDLNDETYSSKTKASDGSFPKHFGFIPTSLHYNIIDTLLLLYNHIKHTAHGEKHPIYFLDIGCGIGNIVKIADFIGFWAYGLEYNTKIYNVAKKLIGKHNAIKGDMLTFKNYHKYDVLYYYQPMPDYNLMQDFAIKLAKKMKVGTYVIPNGDNSFGKMKSFQSIHLGEMQIYQKVSEVKEEINNAKNSL